MACSVFEPPTTTDEDLIQRVRDHDDGPAFETLVHRYERELYGFLRRYLNDAELAEDVFQATFLRVHQKRNRFLDGHRFRPWLYAVATNQAIDARRRNHRHRMASLDHCDPRHGSGTLGETVSRREATVVDMMQNAEAAAWVLTAINALPEPLRSTLDLVYRRGMKHREAAAELGIPVGTVKSRLNAAIHRLHDSWERAGLPVTEAKLSLAQAKLSVVQVRPR